VKGNERQGTRRFGRLGVQMIGATLLVLSLGLGLTSTNTLQSEEELLSEQLDARGNALAQLTAVSCAELILGSDVPRVETILKELPKRDPDVVYVRAEKPDGTKIFEVYQSNHAGAAVVETSRQYVAESIAVLPTERGEDPLPPKHVGQITLGLSIASLATLKAQRTRILALEAGVSFLGLGVVLSYLLRRKLAKPLELLDMQASALGRGDLDTPVYCKSNNEIGRLATTLDGMRENLRASYTEIRANNTELVRMGGIKDRALEDLAKALDAANAANRAKDEFLGAMSHELRTPMNGIIGMTQILMQTPLDEEQRDAAETVRGSAEALLVIVNDVLDFSKLNAGKMDLARVVVDPRALIREIESLFSNSATQKGLVLESFVDETVPPRVIADPARLRQVLANLVGNAVKFTANGRVVVRATLQGVLGGKVELRFTVTDTGVGISESKRPAMFKAFSQGDATMTRGFGGTGLGLVIAQRLVEMMGGRIDYESEADKGSMFWFTVMLERAPIAARPATPSSVPKSPAAASIAARKVLEPQAVIPCPEPRTSPMSPIEGSAARTASKESAPLFAGLALANVRVLLVEDNPVNQKVAAKMLGKLGCTVDVAENGAIALERYDSGRYALVLMDLSMPVMDGLEATRLIRKREERTGQRVPIVALTANAMEGDRERCIRAGMDEYLTKPVRAEGLAEVIGRYAPDGEAPPPAP